MFYDHSTVSSISLFQGHRLIVFNFFSLEHDSAPHDVVIYGIFLLDFSFEVVISRYNFFNCRVKIL